MRFGEIRCDEINSQYQLKIVLIFTVTVLWLKGTDIVSTVPCVE